MQKRGIVVDADDFSGVTNTYPEHPLSKIKPKVVDFEALKQERRKTIADSVAAFNEAHEVTKKNLRGASVDRTYIPSEFLKENPRFTSINQIKANDKIEARKKVNLTNSVHDQKDEVGAPSLAWNK